MNGRAWTTEDDAWLRTLYPDVPTKQVAEMIGRTLDAVYRRAAKLRLKKSAAFNASAASGRLVPGCAQRGISTRFKPGTTPPNKGLRRPGWSPGRMRETQFKAGALPHTTVPVGTETVRADGYVWVKRWEDRRPARRNWTSKHQAIWEAAHGPVPKGHIVIFRDGNRTNFALENLHCYSRAEHASTKGLHSLPPEIVQVHQLRGAIKRLINKRQPPAPVRKGRPPKHARTAP